MVGQSGRRTHQIYLTETIHFQPLAKGLDRSKIADLYVKDALSSAQIAEKLGCSKTLIITTLKRLKLLRGMRGAQSMPKNYRRGIAPYGFRVADGKLTPKPSEIKICRLVIDLVERKGFTHVQAARYLVSEGFKGRNGQVVWHNTTVSRICARWKGKL